MPDPSRAANPGQSRSGNRVTRRRRSIRSKRSTRVAPTQTRAPLPAARAGLARPEAAAKRAVAHRAKPGAPPGHVRLVLTLDLRRALAEQLSAQSIRTGKNLEAVVIDLLEAGVKR